MQTLWSCTLQSTIKQHVRGTNPAVNHLVSALQRHAAENPQECGLQTWMLWNGSKRKEEKFYLLRSLGKIQTTTSLKKKTKKNPQRNWTAVLKLILTVSARWVATLGLLNPPLNGSHSDFAPWKSGPRFLCWPTEPLAKSSWLWCR